LIASRRAAEAAILADADGRDRDTPLSHAEIIYATAGRQAEPPIAVSDSRLAEITPPG